MTDAISQLFATAVDVLTLIESDDLLMAYACCGVIYIAINSVRLLISPRG